MADQAFQFDPEALLKDRIVIDKLDAARRQVESAVTMFFEKWDVISQHTLISAAHGILYDLGTQRGIGGSIKDSPLVPPAHRGDFIKGLHIPQNFFKHADKDSGRNLVFFHQVSHFFLFDAIRLYVLLSRGATERMKIFLVWFQLRYPDLYSYPPTEEDMRKIREGVTDPEVFKAIARRLLQQLPIERHEEA